MVHLCQPWKIEVMDALYLVALKSITFQCYFIYIISFPSHMGAEVQIGHKQKIHFHIQKQVKFGQALYVTGNIQKLGCWDSQKALRLSWNEGHIWTGFIQVPLQNPQKTIEYKYFISDWHHSHAPSNIEWEDRQRVRLLELGQHSEHVMCENSWNIEKVVINLVVPKNQSHCQYFVIGDCKQLGSWTRAIKMSVNRDKTMGRIAGEGSSKTEKNYVIFSLKFQICRNATKINYCYFRKGNDLSLIEKPMVRQYDTTLSVSSSSNTTISHSNGWTRIYDRPNFIESQGFTKRQQVLNQKNAKNNQETETEHLAPMGKQSENIEEFEIYLRGCDQQRSNSNLPIRTLDLPQSFKRIKSF